MNITARCVRLSRLKERDSSHQNVLQPPSVALTHASTHTYTHTYSLTCSVAKPTSLNPRCSSPSVSVPGGLGCSMLSYWTEQRGKCSTIGCCHLVKFFCYHGCRVSCPNLSQCICGADGTVGTIGVLKNIPPLMEVGAASKSLSTDACNEPSWPHCTSCTRGRMK